MLAAKLSSDPLVILVATDQASPLGAAVELAPRLRDRRVFFLVGVHWSLESDKACAKVERAHRRQVETFPGHCVTFLCNTERELSLLRERGIPATLANSNMFVDEGIYDIDEAQPREYDAIYNARMSEYKRHVLCRDVPRVALVYYGMDERGRDYFARLKPQLPNAVFVNELQPATDPPTAVKAVVSKHLGDIFARRGHPVLSARQVAQCCNRARVGLCLSAVEGAMYASMEYLLCGLPVVSTINRGGRDFFFDPEFCLTVEADPVAVKRATDELIDRNLSPTMIREKTLARVLRERERFRGFIEAIYRKAGAPRDFKQDWDAAFIDKMYRNYTLETLLRSIDGAGGGRPAVG